MPAADCVDRASYRMFARLIRDYLNGCLVRMRTAEVADRYRVDRRTAYRWEMILRDVYGLTINKRGEWCEPKL